MISPIAGLLSALGLITAAFVAGLARAFVAARQRFVPPPETAEAYSRFGAGALARFYRALGVGSFTSASGVSETAKKPSEPTLPDDDDRPPAPAGPVLDPAADARPPSLLHIGIGAVTNFFDTLGIGSFATTTALFRLGRVVADRVIPGTLNVGHTLPTVAQTFIYTTLIKVDPCTLFSMIAAAILGAWLGAGVVSRWPKRMIQVGMGVALLVAAGVLLMQALKWFPGGGAELGVRDGRLAIAVGVNFALGALMTLGIGLYAPCMILVSLLGMDPKAAFPIMMGSCAFLMPVGSLRFIRERSFDLRASLGLTLGGIPAVLVAAFIVKEMPLDVVRWLVIVVVVCTAASLLWSALREAPPPLLVATEQSEPAPQPGAQPGPPKG